MKTAYAEGGDRYPLEEARRRSGEDIGGGFWLFYPAMAGYAVLCWTIRRPRLTALMTVTAVVALWRGIVWGAVPALLAVALVPVWRRYAPHWYATRIAAPALSRTRRWYYRRHWRKAMFAVALDDGCGVTQYTPRLVDVRAAITTDVLTVRPLANQTAGHWELRADDLAARLGTGPIHIAPEGYTGLIRLTVTRDAADARALPAAADRDQAVIPGEATNVLTAATTTTTRGHQVATRGRHAITAGGVR